MENPLTPESVRDPIEDLVQSLSVQWNLRLPPRRRLLSPSKRDSTAIEERIYRYVHFLYYSKAPTKGEAFHYALSQFEQEAPVISTQWRFKPRAETGVVATSKGSGPSRDFLLRREDLGEDASNALVQRLINILLEVAEKVKQHQPYRNSKTVETPSLHRKPNSEDPITNPPLTPSKIRPTRQTSLSEFFKSDRNQILSDPQHPSSDGYVDDELHSPRNRRSRKASEGSTNEIERFVTPPTSPSRTDMLHLGASVYNDREVFVFPKPSLPPPTGKKRDRREPSVSSRSRKLLRQDAAHDSVLTSIHPVGTAPTITFQPEQSGKVYLSFAPSGFQDPSSISSSVTSSAWTSPNTSFKIESRNTSSSSLSDHTDLENHLQRNVATRSVPSKDADFPISEPSLPAAHRNDVGTSATKATSNFDIRLQSESPFHRMKLAESAQVPFRQLYEVCRFSQYSEIPISAFADVLKRREDDYSLLWSSLAKIVKAHGRNTPERSSALAWARAETDFQGVSLSGRLKYIESLHGPLFEFKLLPLKIEPSYRLSRHYKGDRFLVLSMPGLDPENLPVHLKPHAAPFRYSFIRWIVGATHHILGRTWRAFFVKPETTKKSKKESRHLDDVKFRIYLFAENGQFFWVPPIPTKPQGEVDERTSWILDRQKLSVQRMIEWIIPFKQNLDKHSLKFFARLSLGLSATVKSVTFTPSQIIRSDDAFANSPCERRLDIRRSDQKKTGRSPSKNTSAVMNDGCARMSKPVARRITEQLNLSSIPSAFQGRIGGAKGMWIVDALEEVPNQQDAATPFWIEITDSQLKFEAPGVDAIHPDPHRVTFEVNAWSKRLSCGFLNYQLMPILQSRGVPRHVFKKLLTDDLKTRTDDLEAAMEDGLSLRKWCQSNFPTTNDRLRNGGIEMLGGLPDLKSEKINWFIDHGFEANTCDHLKNLLFRFIKDYCQRLETRMKIGLLLSTNAFMIADPLNLLEENEIHLGFSESFKDSQNFDQSILHGIDVLVARLPAHLPSDIQKVRAVFKPELGIYRDVIIFSSRGEVSLASKLSGGDYDGDKAWICWEPTIVEPFQNADVPKHPPASSYGIEKDTTKVSDIIQNTEYIDKFLMHAFDFNLQPNLLGICTIYHEYMCYDKGDINSPEAIDIAILLGLLVDSAKAGFKFSNSKWSEYRRKKGLPQSFPKPAYRDNDGGRPKDHLIDDLVLSAKTVRENVLGKFAQKFKDSTSWDEDLVRLYKRETEAAISDASLAKALKNSLSAFDKIVDYWKSNISRSDDDYDDVPRSIKKKEATGPSFVAVVQKCREDFLSIPPCNDEQSLASASPLVQRWVKDHHAGTSTYWDLVKASTAFQKYHSLACTWHIAGLELGEMKATAYGRGTYRTVVSDIFEMLKLDGKLVDGARRKEIDEDGSQMVDRDDDDIGDDEYDSGEWDWPDAF